MTLTRPKILIIYTGGTIGMIENPVTHALQPFDFTHLIDNVPKIKMLDFEIHNIQFNPPIDSAAMGPSHWSDMAAAIEDNYDNFDGFVVLHGTDTMAFTASALSFMLENLHKPSSPVRSFLSARCAPTVRKILSPPSRWLLRATRTATRWCRRWLFSSRTTCGAETEAPR